MKKKQINKTIQLVYIFGLILLYQTSVLGSVSPEIEWETLSTPHFELIFDAKQYETAKKYALRLEFNHKQLMGYFKESPEKTIVVINDNTDLANGYATPIPYPHIMLYPVLPSSHDTVSEYSDWPQELTLHEYVHILNFTPAHGVMKFLRAGFGTIVAPTVLLPRWWHEGVAVEMETRFSSHGRLRSLYQDATLRALVKAQQLHTYSIAEINETDLDSWPRGGRPYLFGSLLLSEIQNQKGETINNSLLERFASRAPYFINSPTKEETNRNFKEWFQEAVQNLDQRAQAQLTKIRETPVTEFSTISSHFMESHSPQLSPNGRYFSFVAKNKWGKSSIQIFDRKEEGRNFDLKLDSISEFLSLDNKTSGDKKDAPPAGNINRISWLPNSTGFIFDQIRFVDSYSNFSDLFFYDLENKKNKRLTTGLRLRDPNLSPDASQIVAVQVLQSNSKLVLLNFDGSQIKELYNPPQFHKISNPFFSENDTLYFTERLRGGEVHLQKFILSTQTLTTISTPGLSQIESLSLESNGISFVAREGGMQNLYWTEDQFKTIKRLTHTDTAVFDGCIDQRTNNLYTTSMTESGLQLTVTPWPKEEFKTPPANIEPLFQDRYGNTNKNMLLNESDLETEFGGLIQEKKPYSSFNYLRPRYWLPFIYSSDSGYGFQVSTSAFDPLEKQTYGIDLSHNSFNNETTGTLNYENTASRWPLKIALISQVRKQPFMTNTYEAQEINILTNRDLMPWSETITLGFGIDSITTKASSIRRRLGPQLVFVYDGAAKSIYSKKPFAGYQFAIMGNHYLKTKDLLALTKGFAKASYFYSSRLPYRHIASAHIMAQEMKGESSITDYSASEISNSSPQLLFSPFVLRGYDPGYFYMQNARSATLEYTLPLSGHRGWGTLPAFLKRTYLNLFSETLIVNGYVSNLKSQSFERTYLNRSFQSYGLELKGDMTLGYYLPLTLFFGVYHRPQYSNDGKTTAFLGIQL